MSHCKVSRLFLQGFIGKILPQLKTECGDFGINRQAWPCEEERHDIYLRDTILICQPERRCEDEKG